MKYKLMGFVKQRRLSINNLSTEVNIMCTKIGEKDKVILKG